MLEHFFVGVRVVLLEDEDGLDDLALDVIGDLLVVLGLGLNEIRQELVAKGQLVLLVLLLRYFAL